VARTGAETEALVRYLVESLVDSPEAVKLTLVEEEGVLRIDVSLDQEDVGKVIGRGGRIIKAIRTLARAAGSTAGTQVDVEIIG
jgi:predicted RNA-binding protein YlqC (UPF0109 family)